MAWINKLLAGVALAATGMAAPLQAASTCWSPAEANAAQIRDMQTMLMVAALRCRAAHIDISADYDGFVIAQKDMLAAANLVIKRHFAAAGGSQADYDRFATSLANGFGDDATTDATCADAAALAHDGSAAAPAQLEQVALGKVFPAMLPGGACSTATSATVAASASLNDEMQPPVIALAAPQEPITLPVDVVAALTVLAHYKASEMAPSAPAVQTAALASAR